MLTDAEAAMTELLCKLVGCNKDACVVAARRIQGSVLTKTLSQTVSKRVELTYSRPGIIAAWLFHIMVPCDCAEGSIQLLRVRKAPVKHMSETREETEIRGRSSSLWTQRRLIHLRLPFPYTDHARSVGHTSLLQD